jgi:hypothetical protein
MREKVPALESLNNSVLWRGSPNLVWSASNLFQLLAEYDTNCIYSGHTYDVPVSFKIPDVESGDFHRKWKPLSSSFC